MDIDKLRKTNGKVMLEQEITKADLTSEKERMLLQIEGYQKDIIELETAIGRVQSTITKITSLLK